MISGKVDFDYFQTKDNYIFNTEFSIEEIVEQNISVASINQILLISENLNQKFKYIHIQPLSSIKLDILDNIMKIHLLLLANQELSNALKLDYAKLQRYFMKKYLCKIIKTINQI
jgi:hypothetical protein